MVRQRDQTCQGFSLFRPVCESEHLVSGLQNGGQVELRLGGPDEAHEPLALGDPLVEPGPGAELVLHGGEIRPLALEGSGQIRQGFAPVLPVGDPGEVAVGLQDRRQSAVLPGRDGYRSGDPGTQGCDLVEVGGALGLGDELQEAAGQGDQRLLGPELDLDLHAVHLGDVLDDNRVDLLVGPARDHHRVTHADTLVGLDANLRLHPLDVFVLDASDLLGFLATSRVGDDALDVAGAFELEVGRVRLVPPDEGISVHEVADDAVPAHLRDHRRDEDLGASHDVPNGTADDLWILAFRLGAEFQDDPLRHALPPGWRSRQCLSN